VPLQPPYLVIDNFLSAEQHDALLALALQQEEEITRGALQSSSVDCAIRRSWTSRNLGDLKDVLRARVGEALPQVLNGLRIAAFAVAAIELELSAHRDGDFYRPHIDTNVSTTRDGLPTDRLVTAVYYFHAQPRGFSGGQLAIHSFAGGGEPVLIEPVDNRLLAFPAFALHEVKPVRCQRDEFAAARLAVNAWIHRARAPVPARDQMH
jgi:SM-20-related protein